MKTIYNYILLGVASLLMLASCQKNDSIITGADASILSCSVSAEGITVDAGISGDQITASLPKNADLEALDVKFVLSEGARMTPAPEAIEDWSAPVTINVVSANGQNEKTYTVTMDLDADNEFDTYVKIGNRIALEKFAENGYNILGGLYIYDDLSENPVLDLSSLANVKEIKTDLKIHTNEVVSVELNELKNIDNIDIQSLSLEKLSFKALESISGRFRIGNDGSGNIPQVNNLLTSIDFSSLKSVGRSFTVFFHGSVDEIIMPNLSYVGEDFKINGGKFTDLSMVKNLKEVRGHVELISFKLNSLEGFNFKKIGQSLTIAVGGVSSLEPLAVLESVPYLCLQGAEDCPITSFKGLENIKDVIAIDVKGLPNVTSTKYLPITDGMDHIGIQMGFKLTSLEGFEKLTEIESLHLVGLVEIKDMHQLENLRKVKILHFQYMEAIEQLPELKNLNKVDGHLQISMFKVLKNLKGLEHIKEVGSLQVDNLLEAETLEGLESLEKVTEGYVLIGANKKLKNLDALKNLKEVALKQQSDKITIKMNEVLDNYCGMKDLLIKYWKVGGGKFPKVDISGNKYNPTYEQLVNGECTPAK